MGEIRKFHNVKPMGGLRNFFTFKSMLSLWRKNANAKSMGGHSRETSKSHNAKSTHPRV